MKNVLVDSRMPEQMKNTLARYGYGVISVPLNKYLDEPVGAHPDMNFLQISDKIFTTLNELELVHNTDIIVRDSGTNKLSYPHDAFLNAVCVGNDFVCREKSVSKNALDYAKNCNMNIIDVNQGYVKCNIVPVNESDKAVITEDIGIANVLRKYSYDVLLLNPGAVKLEPYEYGFIGGASGVVEDYVFFCGNIEMHPQYFEISEFCSSYGKKIVSLSDDALYDYGSILYVNT